MTSDETRPDRDVLREQIAARLHEVWHQDRLVAWSACQDCLGRALTAVVAVEPALTAERERADQQARRAEAWRRAANGMPVVEPALAQRDAEIVGHAERLLHRQALDHIAKMEAENERLRAHESEVADDVAELIAALDQVRALADKWDASLSMASWPRHAAKQLRAALDTPEES